jgi:hypothetical protein
MRPARIRLLAMLIFSVLTSLVAYGQARGQTKTSEISRTDCESGTDKVASSEEARVFLRSFGIDLADGLWKCMALKSAWIEKGSIFSYGLISSEVDSEKRFTLIVLDREPRFWAVPVSSGMVGYPKAEDEPHNRAALTALVAANQFVPTDKDAWISLALLYMNIVGNEIHVEDWRAHGRDIHGVSSSANFFKKPSLNPSVACQESECVVTINDTLVTSETRQVTTWTLTFARGKGGIRLDSADREDKRLDEME